MKSWMKTVALLMGLAAAPFALTGCGGGEAEPEAETTVEDAAAAAEDAAEEAADAAEAAAESLGN